MDNALRYIFILSLVLIFVAYYAGLVTDVKQFGTTGDSILQTLTGRSNGQFANYPGGFQSVG